MGLFLPHEGLVGSLKIAILSPKKIGIESLSKTPGSSPPYSYVKMAKKRNASIVLLLMHAQCIV